MANPSVAIRVALDAKAAEDGFKRLEQVVKNSFTEINSALDIAGKAFALLEAVLSRAIDLAAGWVDASSKSEVIQTRLAAVTGTHLNALQKLNAEMLKKLGIDDDDSAATQVKLAALGVLPHDLERATKATIGLADATGKDLTRAAGVVAMAFRTNKEEAARLERLFGITESTTHTFAGTTKRLATNLGELDETLGDAITQSAGVKAGMKGATDVLIAFTDVLKDDAGRKAVDGFFRYLVGAISVTINAFLALKRGISGIRGSLRPGEADVIIESATGAITALDIEPQGSAFDKALQKVADETAAIFLGKATGGSGGSGSAGGDLGRVDQSKRDAAFEKANAKALAWLKRQRDNEERFLVVALEAQREFDAIELQTTIDANEAIFQAEVDAFDRRERLKRLELEMAQAFNVQLVDLGVGAISNFISNSVAAWASGSVALEQAALQAFGGMLAGIGHGLIALGSAAIAGGILGTVAPIFAPATGGPAGIAAGVGLMAAGTVLVGLGGLAANAGRPETSTKRSGGYVPSSGDVFGTSAQRGFVGQSNAVGATTVFNISFDRGVVMGTPGQIGRALRDNLRAYDRLLPSFGAAR